MNKRTRAAVLFSTWRAQGAPTWITSHEAHRLTDGKVGTFGDHSASNGMNLSTVARRAVQPEACPTTGRSAVACTDQSHKTCATGAGR